MGKYSSLMEYCILNRAEIDCYKWDMCVEQSMNTRHYAMSWYLDIVSPNWFGITDEFYSFVLPIPVNKKFGIQYIIQPFLCQQLGCFSQRKLNDEFVSQLYKAVLTIGPLLYSSTYFNSELIKSFLKVYYSPNYELNLSAAYPVLRGNYSSNMRRNIKKAEQHQVEIKVIGPEAKTLNFIYEHSKYSYSQKEKLMLERIIRGASEKGKAILFGAFNEDDRLLSIAFFLKHQTRITFLASSTSGEGYRMQATSCIFDRLIRVYSGQNYVLDFEGSKFEGIARFYKGFGGRRFEYLTIESNGFGFIKKILRVKRFIQKGLKE